MKAFFNISFLLLFLFLVQEGAGQSGARRVDPEELDTELLREELHRAVNDLRKEKGVTPLEKDPILRKAAEVQASYVRSRERLTHYQDHSKTRTPRKRVRREGGRHRPVGENLLRFFLSEGMNYRELADTLASIWKSSPPHYANIKQDAFERSGLGFEYDERKGVLYIAQVYGGPEPDIQEGELPEQTPYQSFISSIFPPCTPYRRIWEEGALTFSNGRLVIDPYRTPKG